jgi:hypothetical protein
MEREKKVPKSFSERGVDARRTSILEWARKFGQSLTDNSLTSEVRPTKRFGREEVQEVDGGASADAGVEMLPPDTES